MATHLLLEGSDLEALLSRAHAEAGPGARIVRAHKVRQGGFLGFFARNGFEVAVEVPDGNAPAAAPQPGRRTAKAEAKATARAEAKADRKARQGRQDSPGQARAQPSAEAPDEPQEWSGGPAEALLGMLEAAAGDEARFQPHEQWDDQPAFAPAAFAQADEADTAVLDAVREALARADAEDSRRLAGAEAAVARAAAKATRHGIDLPEPGRLEAEGLLDLVDRVDNAERAATRVLALGAAKGAYGATDSTARTAATPVAASRAASAGGEGGHSAAAVATAVLERQEQGGPRSGPGEGAGDRTPAPAEADPVRPSTAGPAFTALLDQLRHEATRRPEPAAFHPTQTAPTQTAPTQTVAELVAIPAPEDGVPSRPSRPGRHAANSPADRDRLDAARRALRGLGVPSGWTRRLRDGDRFGAVLRMLDRLPALDLDTGAPVVAVVGSRAVVRLEAGRTAVDLAVGDGPRPVTVIGPDLVDTSPDELDRIAGGARSRPVVVAIEAGLDADVDAVRETVQQLGAGIVIAVVDAHEPVERTEAWIDGLGGVDALAIEGASQVAAPAAVLRLELPVIRLDGIPVDRLGWAALLCARLAGLDGNDEDEDGGAE